MDNKWPRIRTGPFSPLSRALVPSAFGAAILCVAAAVACVPPKGVSFDVLRYGGLLAAIFAFAGVASMLWSAAESAQQFASERGGRAEVAMSALRGGGWWLGIATGLCAYGGFAAAVSDSHGFGRELGAVFVSLGPLAYCFLWSLAIWKFGPGSPEPDVVDEPLSPRDLAAQAIIASAHEAVATPLLQRHHLPLITAGCALLWLAWIAFMFAAPLTESTASGVFLMVPAIYVTNVLWRMWSEVLGQRDDWSAERDLPYMRAYAMLHTLRRSAIIASVAAYVLWFLSWVPAFRIAGAALAVASAAYWVAMPMYLLRRFDVGD